MTKRTIALSLLLACFAVLFFAGCNRSGSGNTSSIKEVIIGNWWADWDTDTFQPNNQTEEEALEWRLKIQKDTGITIKEKGIAGWGEMLETATTSIMAGNPAAQVFVLSPNWAMALIRQGLAAPLSDSKAIDFTNDVSVVRQKVQHNQEIRKTFTFNGKQYAMYFGYGGSRHSAGIYFNERLFREAGLDPELPFNMQRDHTWNWDNFFEICKTLTRDRNNTGRIDTWATTADHKEEMFACFLWSNGAEYVGKDSSGRFVNVSDSPAFLEALNFIRRMNQEGVIMPYPEGGNWDWYASQFTDGIVAMMIDAEWRTDTTAAMADNWGYVLFPMGPRKSEYSFPNDENVYVVPSMYSGADLDAILKSLELWNMPLSEDWASSLWGVYSNPRSVTETMAMIRGPGYGHFKNHMMIPGFNAGDIAWNIFWWDDDPARLIESAAPNWNSLIADVNSFIN